MITKHLITHDLKTSDITVMSNVTSVSANATKIARVEEIEGHEKESPSTVHLDFKVNEPSHLPAVLEGAKELGMILQLEDAVKLGTYLIAMGLEHYSSDEVDHLMTRLSQLTAEYQSI